MTEEKMTDHDEPEPTEEELRAAEELARALDAKMDPAPGSDAAFAVALRATRQKSVVDVAPIVERAVARGARASRGRTRRIWLVAAAALLAVSLPVGWVARYAPAPAPVVMPTFGGPTDAIFAAPFPDAQRASERMDRIATTRAHDYFAAIAAGAR